MATRKTKYRKAPEERIDKKTGWPKGTESWSEKTTKKGRNKPSAAKLKEFDKKYGDPEKYIKGSDKAPQEQKRAATRAKSDGAKPRASTGNKPAMSKAERVGRAAGTAVKKAKTSAQKGLKALAKGAVPLTLGTAAAQGLTTPTERYEKRFGLKGGTLAKDLGIRTLGVASDIGDVLTLGQASRFYRDKQKPKGVTTSNISKTSPTRSKTASTTKSKPLSKNASPVSMRKTKGGDYPVYKKGSSSAQSFREAFSSARKAGKKEFTWQGRKYNTKLK